MIKTVIITKSDKIRRKSVKFHFPCIKSVQQEKDIDIIREEGKKMQRKQKKITVIIAIMLLLVMGITTASAEADFGSAAEVISADVKVIKTGLQGQKIVFSDLDFKQALCITDFEKIKITKIPSSTEGTLMLAGRRVGEGTEIKRKNLGALVFIPAAKDLRECKFLFTIPEFASGAEVEFILKFTEKVNYAPTVEDADEECFSISTQREISTYGKMYGKDAENDELKFIVVSYPTEGNLQVLSDKTGEFLYTPPTDYVGTEGFSYVVRDTYGNYSQICKVEINVAERMSEAVYADMSDRKEYNQAVALTAMGIMDGKLMGDGTYFMPDSMVTRAEFVTMAMKCASISPNTALTATYFDDNGEIPTALVGYVATAQKMGIINGKFTDGALLFRPNDYITKYEAGVVMANILNATHTGEVPVFSDINTVPVWAKEDIYALCSLGIFENKSEIYGNVELTKGEVATYLCKMIECR